MASARMLIKRGGGFAMCAIAAWTVSVAPVGAQDPGQRWRTIDTEHFRVTFPDGFEMLGRRAAGRAEAAYEGLSRVLVEPRGGRVDLLISDHTDLPNGQARVTPSRRIEIYAPPPMDGFSLAYFDDWLELVITHELVHIFHLDHTTNPIGRVGRAIFGRPPTDWPIFPGSATPDWTIEGIAVWYESSLTQAGRVRGTFHEMQVRTAVLEGRFERVDQASGRSPLWPGGNRSYLYGSLFFDHLLDRYGDEKLSDFVEAVAGQWIPYRLDAAGRSAFGVSLTDAWEEWAADLDARYATWDEQLGRNGPVTEPERLTNGARWGLHPAVSPDGRTLVYTRSDGRSDTQLRRQDPPGAPSRGVGRTNGLATFDWLPDGRLLVSQLEYAGPYRTYGDLYVMELDGGSERITHEARLTQPSASPDGAWAVAVRQGGGTNELVRVDLRSGGVEPLVEAVPDVHWAFPRVSPDGRSIAATRWEPNAYHDVVVLDAGSGRVVQRVTNDRAIDFAPRWSPDGAWLVWSSDRTGVMNVLAAPVEDGTGVVGAPRMLTNVRTGSAFPSVDPDGAWLYFSTHHVDGWEVERVPFAPEDARAAPEPAPRFALEGPPPAARPSSDGPIRDYSAFPTLLPHYWEPVYRDPVTAGAVQAGGVRLRRRELLAFGVGAETTGSDLVGRHEYRAYAHVFTSGGKVEGGLQYTYRGLGNPVLSLNASQRWSAGGQFLGSVATDTLYVLERDRSVGAAVTLMSTRWRRDVSLTFGGSLIQGRSELLGRDLEPSTAYTLQRPVRTFRSFRVALEATTARSHTFQTGGARGGNVFLQARRQQQQGLDSGESGVEGVDFSVTELLGQLRAFVPLWRLGHATHVLALYGVGGIATGPGAALGYFGVGGASGSPETLTGLELFGGDAVPFPVRGYESVSRFGSRAWSASAEYRFPLGIVHRGLGLWPAYLDRVVGSMFLDAGNAWEPNPLGRAAFSTGAEVTVGVLGWYDSPLLVRTGVAVPFPDGPDPSVYVRVGLSF